MHSDCSLSLHGVDRDSKSKQRGEQRKKIASSWDGCSFFPDTTQLIIMDRHIAPLPLKALSPIVSSFIFSSLTSVHSSSFAHVVSLFLNVLLSGSTSHALLNPAGYKTNSNCTSTADLMGDKTEVASIVLFFKLKQKK